MGVGCLIVQGFYLHSTHGNMTYLTYDVFHKHRLHVQYMPITCEGPRYHVSESLNVTDGRQQEQSEAHANGQTEAETVESVFVKPQFSACKI